MNHITPIAPRPSASRIIQLIALASVLILAGWNQQATSTPKEPSIRFIVLDKIPVPMPKRLEDELAALDAVLQDDERKAEHDASRRRKTMLLTNYARTEEIQLYGIVTDLEVRQYQMPQLTNATPVTVQVKASEVTRITCGTSIKAYTTGKPKRDGAITRYTVKRVERLDIDLEADLKCSQQLKDLCPLPWRKRDQTCQASVDRLEVSDLGYGARINLGMRIQNRSGFSVFGVFRMTVRTTQGAHVGDYSFVRLGALQPSKEWVVYGILPRPYSSNELTATIDTTCVFQWCLESP
jgi:hypothetical protein